jgi:hypothetical protein
MGQWRVKGIIALMQKMTDVEHEFETVTGELLMELKYKMLYFSEAVQNELDLRLRQSLKTESIYSRRE